MALFDIGTLILRLAIALVFFPHGKFKLKNWKNTPKFFRFLGVCEVIGSISMLLGFLTELAALGFGIIMLGAIYHKVFKWKTPFIGNKTTGWELDLLLLAAAVSMILFGPGSFSLDAFFWP